MIFLKVYELLAEYLKTFIFLNRNRQTNKIKIKENNVYSIIKKIM